MKFIINTSLDPHFCALFDKKEQLIEAVRWEDRRKTGQIVWDFLEKHQGEEFNFIGGVSGPGGFSNLRAAAGILNALSFRFDLPIHAVRADKFVRFWLKEQGQAIPFVLNSFSDGVFIAEGSALLRLQVVEAVKQYKGEKVFVGFLPSEKQALFLNQINLPLERLEGALYQCLKKEKPNKEFLPDYEFPAV